jgi:hypothetical protein
MPYRFHFYGHGYKLWGFINTENFLDNCESINSPMKAVPWFRRLVAGFPPLRPAFDPRSGHVRLLVDKMTLGQVFSEYLGFHCQLSFHRLLHNHHYLSSGAGTIGQIVTEVPSGLSLTLPKQIKETKLFNEESALWIYLIFLSYHLALNKLCESFWLQIQGSRVRFPALPHFLRSSGSGTGSTQPREDNYGAT